MSICSLSGFNNRLCRHAYLLASGTARMKLSPAMVAAVRGSHNSLYQMALEMEPIKTTRTSQNTELLRARNCPSGFPQPNSFKQTITDTNFGTKTYSNSPVKDVSNPCKRQDNPCTKPKKCDHIMGGGGGKGGGAGGPGGGAIGTGGAGGVPSASGGGGDDKNKNLLMALLAALGAGGLLLWLLGGNKKEDSPQTCPTFVPNYPQRVPANSSDLPKHIPYLLIGGGTASFSAFRAIKSNDATAKVLMITNEYHKPYMRPPLSKELWYSSKEGEISKDLRFKQWTGAERSLYFEPEEFFIDPKKLIDAPNGGIAVAEGYTVKKIDPTTHVATLTDGYEITYDECLIATGCAPKSLTVFENAPPAVREKVMTYRTAEDFERLKRYVDQNKTITIVGNGFTGSELSCALANYSKGKAKVYQVYSEDGNMSKVLPDYLSKWTTRKVEELGVCVISKTSVRDVSRSESVLKLGLNNGDIILSDVVVVCMGCEANTQIANLSGLEVDPNMGGFVVNAELEARRNLFVAGDACCFFDPLLGRRRIEHHDHSVVSGRLAGENMVGKKKPYAHQSMFWSDLGPDIGYEGIGMVDASLPTVGIFALPSKSDRTGDNLSEVREQSTEYVDTLKSSENLPDVSCNLNDSENYGRGVIFYMKNEKIVGILLWNLFNRIGLARTIINQDKKFEDLNEVAKLFEIHS